MASLELARNQPDALRQLRDSLLAAELELFAVKLARDGSKEAELELERANCERIRAVKACATHPNLLQFVQSAEDKDEKTGEKKLALVFSWCSSGDLRAVITERKAQTPRVFLSRHEALSLAVQLTSAVAALHKHGLVHRDLAPRNVLCHRVNGQLQLKLGDFDLCKHVEDAATGNTITKDSLGNPEDVAAAGDEKQLYPRKDVFGLSMTLFGLISLEDLSAVSLLDFAAKRADVRTALQSGEMVNRFGKDFCDALFAMLHEEAAKRITADAALSRFSALLSASKSG